MPVFFRGPALVLGARLDTFFFCVILFWFVFLATKVIALDTCCSAWLGLRLRQQRDRPKMKAQKYTPSPPL